MVNLASAQAAITSIFQTNAALVYRSVELNTSGSVEYQYVQVAATTCHFIRRDQLRYQPVADEDLGETITGYLSFPIGTVIQENDRVTALERTWRVVYAPPTPDFSLEVLAGVVDVSGAVIVEAPVLLDNNGSPLEP